MKKTKNSCYWLRRYQTFKQKNGKFKSKKSLKSGILNREYQNSWSKKMYGYPNLNEYFTKLNYKI